MLQVQLLVLEAILASVAFVKEDLTQAPELTHDSLGVKSPYAVQMWV